MLNGESSRRTLHLPPPPGEDEEERDLLTCGDGSGRTQTGRPGGSYWRPRPFTEGHAPNSPWVAPPPVASVAAN